MANFYVLGSYNPLRGYKLTAVGKDYTATMQLTSISEPYAYIFISGNHTGDSFEKELNRDEIAYFLQLDVVDQFIRSALMLYKK
ncbi:hypothetical protein [Psychrobacter alimentarius]|uniref:hypothetical protein n=1 Tax=Psychrobacter alimentarius TaxID=261164 RepID=UPI003FD5502D